MSLQHYIKFLVCLFAFTSLNLYANLNIVSSIAPINALADGVAQGITSSTLLVPPQASHHHYALKPSNMRALQNAQVIIWIGPSLEIFLEKTLASLAADTKIITIEKLPHLTLYPVRNNGDWESHDHDHHSHIDPHLWLDPQNAIIIVQALAETFSSIDTQNAKLYQTNAANMITAIKKLDKKLTAELAAFKQYPFLVFHDGYQYFEKHYHLNAVGSVTINSDLPPSAQRLHQLHQQITTENIKCVFAEPGTSSAIINTLQRDTKIKTGMLDTMGKGQSFADYLNLLQFDADAIKNCLK